MLGADLLRKRLQQDTTAKLSEGMLVSTSAEGCKYENESLFQSDKAKLPHWLLLGGFGLGFLAQAEGSGVCWTLFQRLALSA